jgi:acetyl-CoA C-acetyltransferase
MPDTVICAPVRTAVGRYGGVLKDMQAASLGAAVISAVVKRTVVDPELIDDVIFGQCYPNGEAPALGRVAALDAGLPVEVPGAQLDRRCGSGLQAVIWAVMQVQTGASDVVLAGGAESMSQVEFYSPSVRWGPGGEQIVFHDRLGRARVTAGGIHHPVPGGMLETAENLSTIVDRDEHPRADSSLESLARLRPVLRRQDPEATVTAGNASGQNDGAAACLVTTRAIADQLGLVPIARLVSWAVAGVPPRTMGIGPVPAVAKALGRAGVDLSDVDLIELNGATGGRILATLLHELARREQRYGLETMCIGGGQGLAALFERVA